MSEPILEQCDSGHFFYKLPDHPKNLLGNASCPYCLSVGKEVLKAEIKALKDELAKLQLKPYQYQSGNDILCGQIHNPLYRNQQQGQVKQGYGAEFEELVGKAQEK